MTRGDFCPGHKTWYGCRMALLASPEPAALFLGFRGIRGILCRQSFGTLRGGDGAFHFHPSAKILVVPAVDANDGLGLHGGFAFGAFLAAALSRGKADLIEQIVHRGFGSCSVVFRRRLCLACRRDDDRIATPGTLHFPAGQL